MSSISRNWSTTSLSENWKFGRNSWVEILVRSFTVLGAHEIREGKCILVSILMCGLRKSELYLAWLLWQLVLPSDWAEFCYKWMPRIQISSTLRDTGGNLAWWQKESLMGETRGPWVLLGTGTVQLNILFTWNRKLTRYMIKTGFLRIDNGAFPTMFSWTAMILGHAKCQE
jgi:hypothetical protein